MHVLTRSVRDSAAMLDQTAGPAPGDFHTVNTGHTSWLEACAHQVRPLKIGFSTRAPNGEAIHPDCVAAVEKTARLCETLGHAVEEAQPDYNSMDLAYHCALMGISFVRSEINAYLDTLGRPLQTDDLEPATQGLLEVMAHASAADYATALKYINTTSRHVATHFFERYDLWLTPTLASPPPELGYLYCQTPEEAMDFYERISGFTPFTGFANATGLPAMSIPLHWNTQGLPIGVQLVGRSMEEDIMFSLAAQLEQACPWSGQYAKISL
jgi:amidase